MRLAVINHNGIIPDLSHDFDIVEESHALQADAILMWGDMISAHVRLCRDAKLMGIPTFVMQHGAHATEDYIRKRNPEADYIFVWGFRDIAICLDGGWKREQIFRIGCPLFERLVRRKSNASKIIYAPYYWEKEYNKALWEQMRFKGTHTLRLRNNVNDPLHIDNTIKLISEAVLVTTESESTFELLCLAMGTPVIPINSNIQESLETVTKEEAKREVRRYGGDIEKDTPNSSIVQIIREVVNDRRKAA